MEEELSFPEFQYLTAPPKHIMLTESLGLGTRFECHLVVAPEGGHFFDGAEIRIPCRLETGTIVTLAGWNGPKKRLSLNIVGVQCPDIYLGMTFRPSEEAITKEDGLREFIEEVTTKPNPTFFFEVGTMSLCWGMYKKKNEK